MIVKVKDKDARMECLYRCRKRALIHLLMKEFAGSAEICFVGMTPNAELDDVSKSSAVASPSEWSAQTYAVPSVILPLEACDVSTILKRLGRAVPRGIFQVEIVKNGRQVIAVNFSHRSHPFIFGSGLTSDLLTKLEAENIAEICVCF